MAVGRHTGKGFAPADLAVCNPQPDAAPGVVTLITASQVGLHTFQTLMSLYQLFAKTGFGGGPLSLRKQKALMAPSAFVHAP